MRLCLECALSSKSPEFGDAAYKFNVFSIGHLAFGDRGLHVVNIVQDMCQNTGMIAFGLKKTKFRTPSDLWPTPLAPPGRRC